MMPIAITLISLLFIGIGYSITEKNAPYLLSGYNTMNKEEQKEVDLKGLLAFFKKFHINLGVSQGIIGFGLYFLDYKDSLYLFIGTYSILAYIYFIIKSAPFQSKKKSSWELYLGVVVLSLCLIGVLGMFYYGALENKLTVEQDQIIISGMYGEEIPIKNIRSIQLTEDLPILVKRTNGYSLHTRKKGYFKTEDQQSVTLFIDKQKTKYIFIDMKKGKDIYYNDTSRNINELLNSLKSVLDPSLFK